MKSFQFTIKNKNVLFAKKLLKTINKNPKLLDIDNFLKLEINMFSNLSEEDIADSLRTLERRKAISFEDKDDLLSGYYKTDGFIWVYVYKERLNEFIKLSNKNSYGLDLNNNSQVINTLLIINSLINARLDENDQVEIKNLKEVNIEILEWIADYSGLIKVIYELEADFDTDDSGRYRPVGAGEFPKVIKICNTIGLKQLNEKLRGKLKEHFFKRIALLLNKKSNIEWRCVKCSRYLDRLRKKEQIENYLVDFVINKFRICYKCRKRNYFTINKVGEIKFSILTKKGKEEFN